MDLEVGRAIVRVSRRDRRERTAHVVEGSGTRRERKNLTRADAGPPVHQLKGAADRKSWKRRRRNQKLSLSSQGSTCHTTLQQGDTDRKAFGSCDEEAVDFPVLLLSWKITVML
jgi:hypothetical protein